MNKVLLFALLMTSAVKASDSADQKAKQLAALQEAIARLEHEKAHGLRKSKPVTWTSKNVPTGLGMPGGLLFQNFKSSKPQ